MKKIVVNETETIVNLQKYYKDCLGYPENTCKRSLVMEILAGIVENKLKESDVLFSIIYEKDGNLICMKETGHEITMQEIAAGSEEEIQSFFDEKDRKHQRHASCSYFRYIGVWLDDDNQVKGKIYYVFRIYGFDEIQVIFLNSLEEAYYEWTKKEILRVANSFVKYKGIGEERKNITERIIKRTEIIFEEKMLGLYGIDLGIITEVSGSYYEGSKCNSALILKIGNNKADGVFFSERDYVEIKKENIRNLRKILEMCQEGHYILAERENDLKWVAKGICLNVSDTNDILFKILDHTFWEMRIGNKFSVCYKYGKYVIRQSLRKLEEFGQVYKKVFRIDADKYLNDIFEKAAEQPHGTSIIILDGDSINDEINRLLNESSGIAIKPQIKIPREFVIGVTSIDGAMIIDKFGKCYAIGAILDGDVAIKGDRVHGARHNAVMRYIKTKRERGLKGIGIIFSEDRTISFVSTEDDLEGHEYEHR